MRPEEVLVGKGVPQPVDFERVGGRPQAKNGGPANGVPALGSARHYETNSHRSYPRPAVPGSAARTGLSHSTLISLILKGIHRAGADNIPALAELLSLSGSVITDLLEELIKRKLLKVTGSKQGAAIPVLSYSLTHAGLAAAAEALDRCKYVGSVTGPR